MGIVLSEDLKLALAQQDNADYPVVLFENLVTAANVTADSEDAAYPASNLANPATTSQQGWRSASTAVQYVTIDLQSSLEIDGFGLARHNLGSAQITTSVEGTTDGDTWFEIVEETLLSDDSPVVFRGVAQGLLEARFKFQPNGTAPRVAVIMVGPLLVFERGVQPHTPIGMGRKRTKVPGESESSDYLGSIVTGSKLQTSVAINMLTPAWVRANLDAFCNYASNGDPFFFVWSPQSYPREVGYVWAPGDVQPETAHLAGYMNFSMNVQGIA